jgi:hypothetical protein
LLGFVLASPALAVSFTIQVGEGPAVDLAPSGSYQTVGDLTFWALLANGTPVDPDNLYTDIAGLEISGMSAILKEDPFITSNISFVNTTAATQTYTITVNLPISGGFAYNATVGSSLGVTVTDSVGGSVTASSVFPEGIYSGQVNGVTILTLMPDPTSVACASAGCSATQTDNGGVPQLPAAPGVATSIGIQLQFTLSAFDQIGITSRFEIINDVPEPASIVLLALGALALRRVRPA